MAFKFSPVYEQPNANPASYGVEWTSLVGGVVSLGSVRKKHDPILRDGVEIAINRDWVGRSPDGKETWGARTREQAARLLLDLHRVKEQQHGTEGV